MASMGIAPQERMGSRLYGNAGRTERKTMSADKKVKAAEKGQPGVVAGESLDSVRNILFGAQMRDIEKKFSRLESRVAKELSEFSDEMGKRMDSLEQHFKKEVEALTVALRGEQKAHEEHVKASTQRFAEIEQSAAQHSDDSASALREIRAQILDQSKSLRDEINQKSDKLTAALDQEAEDLREGKVDRSELGSLLTELGMHLCSEKGSEDGSKPE